jgi:sulfotransferase 6B1
MAGFHSSNLPRPVLRAASGAYRAAQRARVGGRPPRVFLVSYPKAGTHLVRGLLDALPSMRYSGVHLQAERLGAAPGRSGLPSDPASRDRIERRLRGVRNGQYVSAHLGYAPFLGEALAELGYVTIFVVRDPRDVVVSYARWAASVPAHHMKAHLTREGADASQNLMDVITGVPDRAGVPGLESIGERLTAYLPWLDHADHVSRFEQLIGPNGGGTAQAQLDEVRRIQHAVDRDVPGEDASAAIAARVWSPASATFRRGFAGGWREQFTPELEAAFERAAGDAARRLGY